MITNLKAVHHVLFSYDYPSTKVARHLFGEIVGGGAFCCIKWGIP